MDRVSVLKHPSCWKTRGVSGREGNQRPPWAAGHPSLHPDTQRGRRGQWDSVGSANLWWCEATGSPVRDGGLEQDRAGPATPEWPTGGSHPALPSPTPSPDRQWPGCCAAVRTAAGGAGTPLPEDPLLPRALGSHIREWLSLGRSVWAEGLGRPGVPPPRDPLTSSHRGKVCLVSHPERVHSQETRRWVNQTSEVLQD